MVQLKLDSELPNVFAMCEARLPLTGFGPITHVDATPSAGTVAVAPDGHTLVWTIGRNFPKKSLEVALPATVTFMPGGPLLPDRDPFLQGNNSYVEVVFKIPDYSYSAATIDNVQTVPSSKFKLSTGSYLSVGLSLSLSLSLCVWVYMRPAHHLPFLFRSRLCH